MNSYVQANHMTKPPPLPNEIALLPGVWNVAFKSVLMSNFEKKVGMTIINIIVMVIAVNTISSFGHGELHIGSRLIRNKRHNLIFPPASVLQLTVGMSVALDLSKGSSGQISYGFQQNIALPTNYTELLFPPTVRMKRNLDFHNALKDIFHRIANNRAECLKQLICQVAQMPFEGGLPEEIINFIFTPSNHEDLFGKGSERQPFLLSEFIGRSSGNCHSSFPECKTNPVNIISDLARAFL